MMTSMFSPFEALCAESSFGQKLSLLVGPNGGPHNNGAKDVPAVTEEMCKGTRSVPPRKDVGVRGLKEEQPKRSPRFAPELDGVHCFETILPY